MLLQNGKNHEMIAGQLQCVGFDKILFLPSSFETTERKQMCILYNDFLDGAYDRLINVPCAEAVVGGERKDRESFFSNGKCVIDFVPKDILYMGLKEDSLPCKAELHIPYRSLYEFLQGKKSDCVDYLKFMRVETKEEQQDLLCDRIALYDRYEYEYNLQTDFFVWSAARVSWNTNGYFNIEDGHHRVIYLIHKGYQMIPVRMTMADYIQWNSVRK